jgi:hypothetical protein
MTFDGKRSSALPITATTFGTKRPITVELIFPRIEPDGSSVAIAGNGIGIIWDLPFGSVEKLTEPTEVRGWYVPASFRVTGFPFALTLTTGISADRERITLPQVFVELVGDDDPDELRLPIAKLKRVALALSGVWGTAYPPNYVDERRDETGKVISRFETDSKGAIEAHRYGYRLTRTTANEIIGASRQVKRDRNDETLKKVAELYRLYSAESGHGFITRIASDLMLTSSQVKNYLEACRSDEIRLLPKTGRTRTPKAKKRGRK